MAVNLSVAASKNNVSGKSREELALEKQLELERRLMDVSGQLNSGKKPTKTKRESSREVFTMAVMTAEFLQIVVFLSASGSCTQILFKINFILTFLHGQQFSC